MERFVLSTHVESLEKLKGLDLYLFDLVFLGDPTCREYPGNIMADEERIKEAVEYIKGKREEAEVALCTLAEPRNRDLSWQFDILGKVVSYVDYVEVHNFGVLRYISRELGFNSAIMGFFGNIYTHKTLEVLKDYGLKKSFLNPELSMEEIFFIRKNSSCDIIVFAHGKLPLGISEACFIKENREGDCFDICRPMVIESAKWKLINYGYATFSAKDWNTFEYLGSFIYEGFRYYHIQGLREEVEYINKIAYIYKRGIEYLLAGRESDFIEIAKELMATTRYGFCNGYLFKRAGSKYVGSFFGGEPSVAYTPESREGGVSYEEG